MLLRHLHLRATTYAHADHLQNLLAHQLLYHKSLPPPQRSATGAPPPSLLTFECSPTYTVGRREIRTLAPADRDALSWGGRAAVHAARRGGQTTFHGPGQTTAFLVLALDAHGLRPAAHVRLLEEAALRVCAAHGVEGTRTADPGVWVGAERKIVSVGVHLRRNVSLFGLGLNVQTDLAWFERIVACGLSGKETTTVWRERERLGLQGGPSCAEVGGQLAACFAQALEGVEGTTLQDEGDILAIEKEQSWKDRLQEHT